MNDAFLRGEEKEQARDAATTARLDMLRFHGELEDGDSNDNDQSQVKPPQSSKKTDGDKSPLEDRAVSLQVANEDSDFNRPMVKPESESTPKTILFVEKLRRMYEEKAKEKAAGIIEHSTNKLGGLHLTSSSRNTAVDNDSSSLQTHVPSPIVAPSPGVEDVLKDVLITQREQPWLIPPDARVPTTDENSATEVGAVDDSRKHEISESLRIELERKYQAESKGRHRNRNDRQNASNNFQQLLKQRQNLPAYKMREKLLSTINNNQVTVVSGDTGCGKVLRAISFVVSLHMSCTRIDFVLCSSCRPLKYHNLY